MKDAENTNRVASAVRNSEEEIFDKLIKLINEDKKQTEEIMRHFDDEDKTALEFKKQSEKFVCLIVDTKTGILHLVEDAEYTKTQYKEVQTFNINRLVWHAMGFSNELREGRSNNEYYPYKIHKFMGNVSYLATLCAQSAKMNGGDGNFSWLDENSSWL